MLDDFNGETAADYCGPKTLAMVAARLGDRPTSISTATELVLSTLG